MNFLICSLESPGFLYPAIGLAKTLESRGHEISFVSDTQTAQILSDAGIKRVPRGSKDGNSFQVAKWAQPIHVAIQAKHIEYALERFRADVLVGQSLTLGPMIVADQRSLPIGLLGFCTYLWPNFGPSCQYVNRSERDARLPWRLEDMLKHLNQARSLFNLPCYATSCREAPLAGDLFFVRNVPELEPDLDALPDCIHLVGSCLWEPDSLDSELDRWLDDVKSSCAPLVYVQHGRFFQVPSFWPGLAAALRDLGCRVAASLGRLGSVGFLPEGFYVRDHIPQGKIIPSARLIVASANTTAVLGALAAGVPSLLIPAGGEQPEVAELCRKAGVARTLLPEEATPERIREAIQELLTDARYREQAAYYQAAFSKVNGLERAAGLLEILAETRKPVLRSQLHSIRPPSAA